MGDADTIFELAGVTASDPALTGGGEMAALTRAFDWSGTPLGPVERWPRSLRTIVHVILTSRHPMFLWWGQELIQFYNDGYRPSLGQDRHPSALGAHGREFWDEIWPIIGPEVESVMSGGEASWHEDNLVPIARNARMEEVYWTYSYSPVLDDDNRVGGTLVTVQETTQRVLGERRMAMQREIAERTAAEARTVADVARVVADVIAQHAADTPFALLYLRDEDGRTLRLASQVGALPPDARPELVTLDGAQLAEDGWPLARVAQFGIAVQIDDLRSRFGDLPGGPWPEPAASARILPIAHAGQERPFGVLVAGTSPRLAYNTAYREFHDLVASQIASAISTARIHEAERNAVREAEFERARLRLLFEQAPAAICLLSGPDHVFTLTNPRYLELFGRSDILAKPVRDVLPELEGQTILELLDTVYHTDEAAVGNEVLVRLDRDQDGDPEDLYFNFVYAPFREASGQADGIFVHAVDVTDQVRSRHLAEAAVQARDEFLSIASHELRTPVTSIKGVAQLLQRSMARGTLDETRLTRNLDNIVAQADRLNALVIDLMDISRLRAGQLALRPQEIDLAGRVNEAVARLRDDLENDRLSMTVDGASAACLMLGDPDRLEQILTNLLENAAKYSPDGGEITVTVSGDDEHVFVTVRDEGIGLTPGMEERIFEPFGRAPNATDHSIPGEGLGLYISRQITERHGGTLRARSAGEGRGTSFYLTLPRWGVPVFAAEESGLEPEIRERDTIPVDA